MINSVSDILKVIEETGFPLNDIYFRGQKNGKQQKWKLLPSIYRENNEFSFNLNTIFEKEEIYKYFEKYQDEFVGVDSSDLLSIVSILQHHGYPTRLLDVTKNPLSALFFAVNGAKKEDNPVIYLIYSKKQKLSHYSGNQKIIEYFNGIKNDDFIFVNGKNSSQRIRRQQGDFILFFEKIDLFECDDFEIIEYSLTSSTIDRLNRELLILGYGEQDVYPNPERNILYTLKLISESINKTPALVSETLDNAVIERKTLKEPLKDLNPKNKLFSSIKISKE